ncbi:hypothetical protein EMPG_15739 [Blastomyces silverae]|uniref:Uncharacterized protein n=1 Tax=Blastomyces silverae TaxID=2060906 RepID=A0A0H1BBM9_9EURO|nr:hypothetical protein EMPG_15739 [Blastomyces silverae]
MLISTHALPGPVSKPKTSLLQAKIDGVIPSSNAAEHNLGPAAEPVLTCFTEDMGNWAADTRHPIREVGKDHDLPGKNLYEVSMQFCAEVSGHEFPEEESSVDKSYWFKNSHEPFPLPFVPLLVGIVKLHEQRDRIDFRQCTDMMAKLVTDCTAPGQPSRLDYFMGGQIEDADGLSYVMGCVEDYCYRS